VRYRRRSHDHKKKAFVKNSLAPKKDTYADDRPLLLAASCTAVASLVPVALYQLHLISKLPDPPLSVFDSEQITMSKTAHPMGIPDGLLGLASFGTTLTLALLAKQNRTAKKLLGVKLGMDASGRRIWQALLVVHRHRIVCRCHGLCGTRIHSRGSLQRCEFGR
jgi:uncharacterized membrane protein